MPLCEFCAKLGDKLFRDFVPAPNAWTRAAAFQLHPELSTLFDTLQTCHLCKLIWDVLEISPSREDNPEELGDEAYQQLRTCPVQIQPYHCASFFPNLDIPGRCKANQFAIFVAADTQGSSSPDDLSLYGELSLFATAGIHNSFKGASSNY